MSKVSKTESIEKISSILNHEDPLRLIGRGGLSNEYFPEAELIFSKLDSVMNEQQLRDLVFGIFSRQFSLDDDTDKSVYDQIAKNINAQLRLF